jgi:O-methyltransferase
MLDYLDWSSWPAARQSLRRWRLFRRIAPYTRVSREKLATLCRLVATLDQDRVPGAIVECGVFKGGAAAVMAHQTTTPRDIYLFDSFEGLPPPGIEDGAIAQAQFQPGWCAGTEDDVRRAFAAAGARLSRVYFVKGWFAETFPRTTLPGIALLHIDADWYDSVKLCLDTWFDRLAPGGYLVLDDYGRWEGCTRAADEFLSQRRLPPLERTGSAGHYLRRPQESARRESIGSSADAWRAG